VSAMKFVARRFIGYAVCRQKCTVLGLYNLKTPSDLPASIPSALVEKWDFHLLESIDLDNASQLAVDAFYRPRVTINSKGMSSFEVWFAETFVGPFNAFDKFDAFLTNKWGFESRSRSRLSKPSLKPSSESFILATTLKKDREEDANGNEHNVINDGNHVDSNPIVGIVEISLEKPDGNLAPAVQIFPRPPPTDNDQAYLCNLCVSKQHRRTGMGKALCQLSEQLVVKHWGRKQMYLHVEDSNDAARTLYTSMGYEETPGLNPFEAKLKGMENIRYYKKSLKLDDY